ncbi:hypothetical protein TNCV_3364191 [Trichonephila clavipes]|nr:hypothetical protein TNCV_3364191 [Trichonephila clavipes]
MKVNPLLGAHAYAHSSAISFPNVVSVSNSPLVSMERKGIRTAADSVRPEWPLWHATKSKAVFARRRSKSKPKRKLLDIRAELEKRERERGASSKNHDSSQSLPPMTTRALQTLSKHVFLFIGYAKT